MGKNVNSTTPAKRYDRLLSDDPARAAELMNIACLSEKTNIQQQDIDQTQTKYGQLQQEGYKTFAGIRLIRMYEKIKNYDLATVIINELVNDFPDNLLIGREIARMITQHTYMDTTDRQSYLDKVKAKIISASKKMGQEEAEKFIKYYEWVLNL